MGLFVPHRALSDIDPGYPRGFHRGNPAGLVGVDSDFIADNIKWNITLFGVLGTMVIWQWRFDEDLSVPTPEPIDYSISEDHSGGSTLIDRDLSIPTPDPIDMSVELSFEVADDCEAAWNEYVQAGVTVSVDNVDFKVGAGCNKWDMDAAVAVGRLVTQAVGPIDATDYKYIKVWLKSSIAINTNELSFLVDDTPQCLSPLEDINIGALVANTWTEKTIPLANPAALGAVVSIGIDQDVDKGAFTLRVDQVRFTKGG